MPDTYPIDDSESLRAALTELLEEADRNDVDIEGGLTILTAGSPQPNWEVQIWRIE